MSHLFASILDAQKSLRESDSRPPRRTIRVAILRNFTTEFLDPFLKAYFARIGTRAEVVNGGFNTIRQDLFDPEFAREADLVVLALDLSAFPERDSSSLARRALDLAEAALERFPVPVILNTFLGPVRYGSGINALLEADSAEDTANGVNQALIRFGREHHGRIILIDWLRLAVQVGAADTFDSRMEYMAGSPFKPHFLSAYAFEIFKIGNAIQGGAKKCLILDCDNTLWGGVVGEAGRDGIALDAHTYPGKAFYDFQKSVLRLAERGVLVALCSKNEEQDVFAVLDHHPACLLKREHCVAWRIDWKDKERNIEAIVRELNIGMDSVVFVDDNPTECARVANFLPEVTVLRVPDKPFLLPGLLETAGLFDTLAVSREDRDRIRMVQAENARRQEERHFGSAEEFLASLSLSVTIRRMTAEDGGLLARVAQLTQKTNQFNLTTRRYSEAEIAGMAADPNCLLLGMSVADRYGEYGLTGVMIARVEGEAARIDSFLMSCRILGRNLERVFATETMQRLARGWPVSRVVAEYLPTPKNAQTAGFWPGMGLNPISDGLYGASFQDLIFPLIPYIKVTA